MDIGATFVHCPHKNNPIFDLINQENVNCKKALINSEHYYY